MLLEEVKRKYLELSVARFLARRQIEDVNNLFIDDLKSRGIIPNCYCCQRCGNELVTETEVPIVLGLSPLCNWCLGNITITQKMVDDFIKERKLGVEE